jgi:hypothetical protein
MTPLARTLYYANLCGSLALLVSRNKFTTEQAHDLLKEQGLDPESIATMWPIASDNSIT